MPEGLQLNADGTATVTWDERSVTLRRPKLREYRSFLEEREAGQLWITEHATGEGDAAVIRDLDLMGTDEDPGPNLKLWSRVLTELGGQEPGSVAPLDLAVWMAPGGALNELVAHWRTNPLAHGATETTS